MKIEGLSRYEITVDGVVRNKTRILRQKSHKGYKSLTLTTDSGEEKQYQVHRLVSMAFIPNPENKPQVNHKNGIKDDNRVENLEWCTQSENMQHAYDTGLIKKRSLKGIDNPSASFSLKEIKEIRRDRERGLTYQAIADKWRRPFGTIYSIATRRRWNY